MVLQVGLTIQDLHKGQFTFALQWDKLSWDPPGLGSRFTYFIVLEM